MQEKNLIKIVADTNILVSALIGKHLQKFLDYWELDYFRIIYSRETLQELVEVLERKKFKKYISPETKLLFFKALKKTSFEVFPEKSIKVSRDIKDNMFLECAVEGNADYIVSGDIHLLELKEYQGIKIVSSSDFLKLISKEK
ncbi:MAG: PilT protein [uncultured bacterium]|nr:MAG: PilT protein [uncultured bacterium]